MKIHGLKRTVGALAFAASLVGGTAFADDKTKQQSQSAEQEREQEAIGGSGEAESDEVFGGSGVEGEQGWIEEEGQEEEGVGGSGIEEKWDTEVDASELGEGTGGAGEAGEEDQGPGTDFDATDIGPVLDNSQREEQEEGVGGAAREGAPRSSDTRGFIDATEAERRIGLESDPHLRVHVGAGVGNFMGDLDEISRVGPTWSVTAEARDYEVFGFEVGYGGARNPLDDDRLVEDASIWKHGVDALVKVGPMLDETVRPFVGAGVGVAWVNPNSEAEDLYNNDFLYEVPLAAGVEVQRGMVNAGIRGTYRLLFSEEFAEAALGEDNSEGGFLGGLITIGGRF